MNVLLHKLLITTTGVNILDSTTNVTNSFNQLKLYHETFAFIFTRFGVILDALYQLKPNQFTSLSDSPVSFLSKVIEYDVVSPTILSKNTKTQKLQRFIATDDQLINTMSTYYISTKAAKKTAYSYDDITEVLYMACNVHDATDISKKGIKPRSTRQVLKGNELIIMLTMRVNSLMMMITIFFYIDNAPPDSLKSFTTSLVAYTYNNPPPPTHTRVNSILKLISLH